MEKEIILGVISGVLSSGAIGSLFMWFIRSNFGNVVKIAVLTERIERLESDVKGVKSDIAEVKTNYNSKFRETREHVTAEVNRAIEKYDETAQLVAKINTRCVVFHPELVQ